MATDYFLKLEGIKGESKDAKHKDEIDLLSFSWGATQQGTHAGGGGGGAGKVSFQDFHFVMKMSKASPLLLQAVATGKHIKQADLVARKAGGKATTSFSGKLSRSPSRCCSHRSRRREFRKDRRLATPLTSSI